jgi:hypothetical protein
MAETISPTPSVELLVRMGHLLDFKDKVLKIWGSAMKVSALNGSPNEKELRSFASQLSTARRWMKFGKIIRSTPDLMNPLDGLVLPKSATFNDYFKVLIGKLEFISDIIQMIAEDVHTLHKVKFWTFALGFRPIKNIDVIEDRAWCIWSIFATVGSYIEMRELQKQLRAVSLRLEALNPATVPDEIESMKKQAAVLKVKYYLSLFKFVKFACEVVDSSIALTPDRIKAINPRGFELLSCFVGSLSAVSSLHKLLFNESKAIATARNV